MASSVVFDSDSDDDLPSGWREKVDGEKNVFFFNENTKEISYVHPKTGITKKLPTELPYGWIKKTNNEHGKELFYNIFSKKTTRINPSLAFPITDHFNSISETTHKFFSTTTASQVLQGRDLTGLHVLITGGSSGIGLETTRSLINFGATVIIGCKNMKRGERVIDEMKKYNPLSRVHLLYLDLSNFSLVTSFAREYLKKWRQLDILILNAAVFWFPYQQTVDGFEYTFQVNYLSNFLLVKLLKPSLLSTKTSKIIFLVPESHKFSDINISNLTWEHLSPFLSSSSTSFDPLAAYNNSKLCLALLCYQLHRSLFNNGVMSLMVHPGNLIYTSLCQNNWLLWFLHYILRPFSKTCDQAAASVVFAAAAREIDGFGGMYINNCLEVNPCPRVHDCALSHCLWLLSNYMINNINKIL